jgi:hypothetical protein
MHARRGYGQKIAWATLVFPLLLSQPDIAQSGDSQDFESWPTTVAWGTTTHAGWTLSDGQVKINRGGFGPPIDSRCGWLHDFDDSTNSWLQSPLFAPGVLSVALWTRRDATSGGTNFAVLQTSSNGVAWVDVEAFAISEFDWTQQAFAVDSVGPTYIRIRKTGDNAVNSYAGLDDIAVTPRPAVFLSNLMTSTGIPSLPEELDIFVDALIHPTGSNIVITTYYRRSTNDAFTAISMAPDEGDTYKTESPIPLAGFPNGVEYYVEAVFDEGGPAQVFLPPEGSNAPAYYSTITLTGETTPRQLSPSSDRSPHIISEIMYHPADSAGTNSLEYVELFNTDAVARDISGFRISGDADYTFPPGTIMAFRSYVVVARDPTAVQQAYGISNVFGPFTGSLPNNGGTVRLRNDFGGIVLEVDYDDQLPWPIAADGAGHSLQLARPDFGEGSVRAWQASAFVGGSPGKFQPLADSPLRNVVIDEYLAHTDLPEIDYIELYNRGTQAVDISGCALSDTLTTNKYVVPAATMLQPGEHIVFDQTNQLGFSLSSGGDDIFLWAPDVAYVMDAVRFDAQANGVPSGRYPDGASSFHALDAQTPGTANASAELLIHDVVINEIMYAPLSSKERDAYIELYNRGTNDVDLSHWRFVNGIDYLFPAGAQIPAGGYVVIARDLENLLSKYPQLNTANAFGNYAGRLSNRGDRIALAKPDDPGLPFEDLVIVDEVTYGDGDRWGKWTDGGGSSLELTDPRSDNRLAMNWRGSDESAKSSWISIERTGALEHGADDVDLQFASNLYVFLPQAGECLVDDIEVIREGDTTNRISNPEFDSGLTGWVVDGTHFRSTHEVTNGFSNPGSLHVQASGKGSIEGWAFLVNSKQVNNVRTPLTTIAQPGEIFTLRAKARWLAGWPYCVLGFDGHWLEAAGELSVPDNLGSPGIQNGSYANNIGPAIYELMHQPILPAANEPVTVTCRAHDPDGLASLTLEYRTEPSVVYTAVPMGDDGAGGDALAGDGVYSATIPGKSSGVITAFRVKAEDNHASPRTTWFPSNDLMKDALVRFGEPKPSGVMGTYIVWMSSANVFELTSREPGGDQFSDMTFICEDYRAIYNGGLRFRGNSRGGDYQVNKYACSVPESERFLGSNEIKIDAPQPPSAFTMASLLEEYHAYWIAREAGAASSHLRFILTRVNGSSILRHHIQTPSRDFCKSWYGDDDPVVFEDRTYDPFVNHIRSDGLRAKAKYRFGQQRKRTALPSDSFDTLYSIIDAALTPDDARYDARMAALIDPYGFTVYFAVNQIVGNSDSYGRDLDHNMFYYLSSTHRSRLHLHDLDAAYRAGFNGTNPNLKTVGGVGTRLYNRPMFSRAYWRIMKNIAEGPFSPEVNVPELQGWYDVLKAHGVHREHPQRVMDVDAVSRAEIFSQLPSAPFTISQNNFSTTGNIATLNGTVPLDVTSFRINGRGLRVVYSGDTQWHTDVGLADGLNALVVDGLDRDGNMVGSDSVTVTLTTVAPSPTDQLVISEIMYHPSALQAEYVEIFNCSSDTFDLGGWRLNGVDHVFDGGALIGPGEYRVVAENITAYQHAYANAEVVIGDYAGILDNGGETLTLEMPVGSNAWMEIDKVRYDDAGAWPTNADGTGASLQLVDLNADNSRAGNWGVVPTPEYASRTPGTANSNAVTLFAFRLLWINEVMPSNVSVIADNFGEFEPWIELYNADTGTVDLTEYRLSNDYGDLARWAFPTGTTIAAGARLCVWADGETNETDVGFPHADFRLNSASGAVILARQWMGSPVVIDHLDYAAVGEDASFGSFPDGDPFSRVIFPTPTPSSANSLTSAPVQIAINEWMSDNETFLADPTDGNFEDWFELYNPSAADVNLGGYYLTDNLTITDMFAIPGGTVFPAHGFLFVWADSDAGDNGPGIDLHVNFGLSRNGDTIGLYTPDGSLVDAVVFGSQGMDHSDGYWPDGEPAVYPMTPPTPGNSNSVFIIVQSEGGPGTFTIDVAATSGGVYRVEVNDDMLSTNWILLDIVTSDSAVLTFTDTNAATMPARFYRLSEN